MFYDYFSFEQILLDKIDIANWDIWSDCYYLYPRIETNAFARVHLSALLILILGLLNVRENNVQENIFIEDECPLISSWWYVFMYIV